MAINPKRNGVWDGGNFQVHVMHGALSVETKGHAASTGLVDDETTDIKFGRNPDIDTAGIEDINSFGNLTYLTSASTFTVVSDQGADDGDPAGTGAWTVTLVIMQSDYTTVEETLTLNGVTGVVSTNSGIRLVRAYCNGCGSGGTNVGNIAITATTGGTTQGYIPAGAGQTQQVAYTVPAGYTAYVLGAQFSCGESKGGALKETTAFVEGFIRLYDETSTNNYACWRSLFQVNLNNRGASVAYTDEYTLAPIPEKTDLKVSAQVGANDTSVTGRLFILLREN